MKHDSAITELLSRPSVEGLIYALRHREVWPEGFEWGYNDCETCAAGMTMKLWHLGDATEWGRKIPNALGMSLGSALEIFSYLAGRPRFVAGKVDGIPSLRLARLRHAITPEHVAVALERYLDARAG